ncbi:hypothetical protein BH11MYX4_BH11MYX4_60060 [soil metagenome]
MPKSANAKTMPPSSLRPSHQRSNDAFVRKTRSRPRATPIIVCAMGGVWNFTRS